MTAMKEKDSARKETLRVVMGEFGRTGSKVLSDEDVVKILKKLAKSEAETLEMSGGEAAESAFIRIIEGYLPKMASEAEVRTWISQHIDFAKYKHKMQAMREIMGHFGADADGSMVRRILESMD